ncbi:hypothetical protein [Aeromonas veronii]|uniref:hypothetical protein n=1 Tax=Aeromonas veronii TaxID=654 RepID=UPI002B494B3E|nr:hypothetical protein [Aeromonas veronii]
MKLRELAVELFGIEYNNEHKFKQAMIASSLAYAPKQAQELVMECDIDITAVSGCAALIGELVISLQTFKYTNRNSAIEYHTDYAVHTANDIAAVMILSKTIILTNRTKWDGTKCTNILVAAYKFQTATEQITRKQAAERLKADVRLAVDTIYNQYETIDLEALMGIEVLERYKNLR